SSSSFFSFFTHTATTDLYTLSLHDALPIWRRRRSRASLPPADGRRNRRFRGRRGSASPLRFAPPRPCPVRPGRRRRERRRAAGLDRKSTRLNSSHVKISYAVFCLKKKKNIA